MREGDRVYYKGIPYIYSGCERGLVILKDKNTDDMLLVCREQIVAEETYINFLRCLEIGFKSGDIGIEINDFKAKKFNDGFDTKLICDVEFRVKDKAFKVSEFATWSSRR